VNGKTFHRMIHRLVAEAFNGPRPPGEDVRHLDGTRGNSAPNNLAYGPRWINMLDAKGHGTLATGERNGAAKLTTLKAIEIAASFEPAAVLAQRYGVKVGAIRDIRSGRTWSDLTSGIRRSDYRQRGNDHWRVRRGIAQTRSSVMLTEQEAIEIASSLEPANALATKYHVSRDTIQDIRSGRTWSHATADVRHPDYRPRGQNTNLAKLTEQQVLQIYDSKTPRQEIAKAFSITPSNVNAIRRGQSWRSVAAA
jgi:hypothetical protein